MAKNSNKKEEIGLGLRALLEGMNSDITADITDKELVNTICDIPIQQIEVNPYQPRKDFDEVALQELAESIKIHGIIQPITVRVLAPNQFQLISGERRLRASKLAGLTQIPAYIRIADDQAMLEIALIENIQREDLNDIEVALTYHRLIEECKLIHEQLAQRVGKSRSTVTNFLRLLKLPPEIQLGLKNHKISMGHARPLLSLEHIDLQLNAYKQIINQQLSVRQVEQLVKTLNAPKIKKNNLNPNNYPLKAHFNSIEKSLSSQLSAKVALKVQNNGRGQILIPFVNTDDLNRLLDLLKH